MISINNDFYKNLMQTSIQYQYLIVISQVLTSNVNFLFRAFFHKKFLNVHLQYVCNVYKSIEKIQRNLREELTSQSMHYQPLSTLCIVWLENPVFQTLSVRQEIFFFSIKFLHTSDPEVPSSLPGLATYFHLSFCWS